jgi:hypothetical protein
MEKSESGVKERIEEPAAGSRLCSFVELQAFVNISVVVSSSVRL